ncbi:MAG: AlkZ family DNA glycosylase [Promethearchaeota archaeon]|nr:MAG: AlkZ family DNA glycosylase [Candidatus Lokiarchaeota archaeon]
METFELNDVNRFVLEKHHLTADALIDDIIQISDDLCGLHSTRLSTSYLSLFARTKNFKKIDLERELYINKTLGRIRGMRRTLFIETIGMIPIVHNATFKLSEKNFEKYMEFHKVSVKEYQDISERIMKILKGRELSASELRKELASKSNIPAIIHLMCNYGLLIRGTPIKDWKDMRNKYAVFREYFPTLDLKRINEKEAIKILVEKYIKTYGPTSENDISWWTGLTKTEIKVALQNIESQLIRVNISSINGNFIILNSDIERLQHLDDIEKPIITLLPELDPYPMGYKNRERYIDTKNYSNIFDRSGNIARTIFLDGVAIGVWDAEENQEPTIKFHLFHSIKKDLLDELYSKAQKVGHFYFDNMVNIQECKSMIPLTQRKAGGFMTPLKNC